MDWGQAANIIGIGFGGVLIILSLLALVIWLCGRVIGKIEAGKKIKESKSANSKN